MERIRITSVQNPLVKQIAQIRKNPTGDRFLVEGTRFAEELPPDRILQVFTSDPIKHAEFLTRLPESVPVWEFSPEAMKKICAATSPQTIACTVCREEVAIPKKLVLLDRVQDPGNVGTVVRTAYAFGFGVICSRGCANPFSPKALMASAGAFRNCYLETDADLPERIEDLRREGFSVCATAIDPTAVEPEVLTPNEKRAVIIGSEGRGISPQVLEKADQTVFIPMQNPINSLNAACAAAIMIYLLK